MAKGKSDPSKSELGSPNVEGQGTTVSEKGMKRDSSLNKQKRK